MSKLKFQLCTQLFLVSMAALNVFGWDGSGKLGNWIAEVTYPSGTVVTSNPTPIFQKGYLVARRAFTYEGETGPNLWVYGPSGQLLYDSRIWFPDAAEVTIRTAGARNDGVVVLSVSATKKDGSTAFLLCLIERTGRVLRVIRTNPFFAEHVCFGPDGSLWTFRKRVDAESVHDNVDHKVFARYSLEGKLLGQYVLRSSFQSRVHPASGGGVPLIDASADRVGAYSVHSREWIEFEADGRLVGRWVVPPPVIARERFSAPRVMRIKRIAFTLSGSVYAWGQGGGHIGLYQLNRVASRWEPVPDTVQEPREDVVYGTLLGADGDFLVLLNRSTSRVGFSAFRYKAPPLVEGPGIE